MITKLPGGKFVVGMLPPLDPGKDQATGQPVTPATGRVVGQSVSTVSTVSTTQNGPTVTTTTTFDTVAEARLEPAASSPK